MNPRFQALLTDLERQLADLTAMPPRRFPFAKEGRLPERGVYLFSDGPAHLYVGRSDRLHARVVEHGRENADHNTAPFAFKLARHETGLFRRPHKPEAASARFTRTDLQTHATFGPAFLAAKRRVRAMDVRCVPEDDPAKQALLEAYCIVALETPYNDFDNH